MTTFWFTYFMNISTGTVDNYNGWWYEDENGKPVNAVDRGEVVQVSRVDGEWCVVK
jgi:hypothetical protein